MSSGFSLNIIISYSSPLRIINYGLFSFGSISEPRRSYQLALFGHFAGFASRESLNASEVDERQLANNDVDKVIACQIERFIKINLLWKRKIIFCCFFSSNFTF